MKILKRILLFITRLLGVVLVVLVLFAIASIIPIDHTYFKEKKFYNVMMQRLDSVNALPLPKPQKGFTIGYGKENLTPPFKTATAGYGNRRGKSYTTIHDSIFVRCMVIDNGTKRIALVSADLLILPPTVTERLAKELPTIGFTLDNTYLGAIHSHNSIGNWGKGATSLIYGAYEDSIVSFITDKIKRCIVSATLNMLPANVRAGEIAVSGTVRNRLDKKNGTVDSLLRVLEVHRSDSSKLLMVSYTAHATCLYSKDLALSRDYPGALVDKLEDNGYDFAMFMAGAMGSHACTPPAYGVECISWMADTLTQTFLKDRHTLQPISDSTVAMRRVPLALGEAQVKVLKDWRIRPWLFKAAFGEYPVYLTALRVGNMIMLGTPCDFSGELTAPLDSMASKNGFRIMVTSFNGGYIGYITPDKHYDSEHYETRLMNWYGPGNGAYISECLRKMVSGMQAEF